MKWQTIAIVAVILFLFSPVAALSLNFQNPTDTGAINITRIGSFDHSSYGVWAETTNGGNNYISIYGDMHANSQRLFITNKYPLASTYAAATILARGGTVERSCVGLFDSAKTKVWDSNSPGSLTAGKRIEVIVSGGYAKVYQDGVLFTTSTVLAANPSYIGFGSCFGSGGGATSGWSQWDNFVYGESSEYILGLPESLDEKFVILDDRVNSANSGLWNTTSDTRTDANTMYGQFGRGNKTQLGGVENKSINLVNIDTGTIYWTDYTGTAYLNSALAVPIKTALIDIHAPDGYYALTIPGTGEYSNSILKRSQGATVNFDRLDYGTGDMATATYEVRSGDYWDTTTYIYLVKIIDIYGNVKATKTLTERTGTLSYLFVDGDTPGVYYAIVQATPKAGGSAIYLDSDYAELHEIGIISGYVTDQNGAGLSTAFINFTQGNTIELLTTGIGGNYTSSPFFITGEEILCNVTASGYRQHYYNILPLSTSMKHINFTLPSLSLPFSGLGIDGVAMEGYLDGLTIRNGYGNTISGVTVNVTNISTGQSYTKYTNSAGWYLCDEGASCHLLQNVPYAVEGMKSGYENSSIYTKVASGVL